MEWVITKSNNKYLINLNMIKIAEKGLFHSIEEFQIIQDKNIGTGSFGVVKLAIHRRTYKAYALKIVLSPITED